MRIRVIPRYRWLVVIAWGFLGTLGCAALRPTTQPLSSPAATQLLSELQARAVYWQAFQAQAAVRIQSPSGNYRLQAFLVASPPDRLRFEATNPAGQTVWVLILNPEGALFWLPGEGVSYHARHGETILNHFAGAPIPPDVFAYSFVGVVPPDHLKDDKLRLVQKGEKILGRYSSTRTAWQFTWQFLDHPAALQSLTAVAGHAVGGEEDQSQQRYTIQFEPAVALPPQNSPQKVMIATGQWHLEGTIRQLVRLEQTPPHVFDHIRVPGSKNVDLDVH